jgi:beta-galactosidase
MNRKTILLFVAACAVAASGQSQGRPRDVAPLTEGWKFIRADVNGAETPGFDDSGWAEVTLPHTWNAEDVLKGDNYYRGAGWYRGEIPIPTTAKGRRIFIYFEAASTVADVYFNGVHLGQHRGGFTAFCFELTQQIRWGYKNVLSVRVDNSYVEDVPPLGGDFNIYGGLYRPAWLVVTNPVCITPMDYASPGIYLKQVKVGKKEAKVGVIAKVSNGLDKPVSAQLQISILDSNTAIVAKGKVEGLVKAGQTKDLSRQIQIKNPHLWNGLKDPYMYAARVELLVDGRVVDEVDQPMGLRWFSVDPDKGFFLNGQSYPLRGVNRHQDRIGKGWAVSYADQEEDADLILELGANCVRLAHYPHSNYFHSLCDRNGLIAWSELPLVNQVFDTNAFKANAKQQLTELIRQNYNHPSIMFWGLYNELGNSGKCDDPRALLTELNKIAKKEDPTRLTTAASNNPSDKWPGVRAIADLVAWNAYPGWYRGTPPQMVQDIDGYKKDAGKKPVGISEYGAGASVNQHEQNMKKGPTPAGKWHPEEWQAIVHEENYKAMEARPYLWGTFVWVMFDFGAAWRNEGDTQGVNDKGLVTADRKTRKDAFYFYKAKWTTEPFVYIASRRDTERKNAVTTVKVYSNCESVKLKVNEQSLGVRTDTRCIFKWPDVELKEGQNAIEVIGTRDTVICTDNCVWQLTKEPPVASEPVLSEAERVEPNQTSEPNS